MVTLRALLSVIADEDLECRKFDIKNAFTEFELKEIVFLKPSKGVNVTRGKSLRFLRPLYGLKQSMRDWNLLLPSQFLSFPFKGKFIYMP